MQFSESLAAENHQCDLMP